ncbi:ABC transporter permease [Roseomonas sp. NAR14]|uniref:ABC transporter permease n=1 Tax=Roseomonas acroporae TaxID=2937791 RepID=A0A9X1Y5T9_9PROT|nr:ABC transporter permease [Roseomonas acroporae]MCK8784494.1 ABC transporter permease [Roseomonas acroporae]
MRTLRGLLLPTIGMVAFVLLWEAAVDVFRIPSFLVPAPSAVYEELIAFPGWYAEQTAYTAMVTLAGFVLAAVLGFLFAVVITESPLLDRLLFPLFVALNSIPKVAIAPLFLIWFGTGALPKVAIAFLVAVFAVVIDASLGLRSVHPDVLDLARALRGSRLKVLLRIKLFAALPSLFAGLKVAMALALVGAIVGEFVSSQNGLGQVILSAQGTFDTARVFAALTILAVLGVALIGAVDLAEHLAMPWRHRSVRRQRPRAAAAERQLDPAAERQLDPAAERQPDPAAERQPDPAAGRRPGAAAERPPGVAAPRQATG